MWKYYISQNKPWWSLNDNNKPNPSIFKKWETDNLIEVETLFINSIDEMNISINSIYNQIQYLKIVDVNDNDNVRYYYTDSIDIIDTNSYRYNMVLDIYTSFVIPFIEFNYNDTFTFLRQMKYEHKCLEYTDEILDQIPKIYTKYFFQKILFNNSDGWWYNNKFGIKNCDVNVNRYYVFNDGVNGGYNFYPIMSKNTQPVVITKNNTQGRLLNTYYFKNTIYNGNTIRDIPSELNTALNDAYSTNKIIKWYTNNLSKKYKFPAEGVYIDGWDIIENVPYGIKPIDINYNIDIGNNAGRGFKYINCLTYMLGQQIKYETFKDITSSKHDTLYYIPDHIQFKVEIYENTGYGNKQTEVNNTIDKLEELRNTDAKANKFIGIFYLPHLLNFQKINIDSGNYLYITIDPKGEYIEPFSIFEYKISNIVDKLNNTSYSTPYLLRWLNIKYFGNDIKCEYRINYQNKIYLSGLILFTDTFSIISKTDDLLDLENSIISLPYQLPTGIDTYINYVKANRNTTNTSFNLAKQEANRTFGQSIANGIMDYISGGVKAVGNALTGDFGKAASAATDSMFGLVKNGFNISNQIFNMKKMISNIKAEYADKRNTMGTQILFSTIKDASLITYYNDDSKQQYDGVELLDLDPSIISIINNYLLLNGYFLPHNNTFEKEINNGNKFNFIQLDNTIINENINISYSSNSTNEIIQIVKDMLIQGIRIWNISDITIPNYNTDEEWITNPDDYTPQIPLPPTITAYNFDLWKNYTDYLNQVQEAGYTPTPYQVVPYTLTQGGTYETLFSPFDTFIQITGNLIFWFNIGNKELINKWINKEYESITLSDLYYDPNEGGAMWNKNATYLNNIDTIKNESVITIEWKYEIYDPNYCDTFIRIDKILQNPPKVNYQINIIDDNNYILNYYEEFKANNPDKEFKWVNDNSQQEYSLITLLINNKVVWNKGE